MFICLLSNNFIPFYQAIACLWIIVSYLYLYSIDKMKNVIGIGVVKKD